LIERRSTAGPPGSFAHFGFSCASRADVDRRAEAARADGILEMEPHDAGPIVGYYCIVRDPDGNSVEFSYGQTIDPGFFRAPRARR
jgi:catechol 2,3-dioxygenase-like lactoylglutathione lyase family enzyme